MIPLAESATDPSLAHAFERSLEGIRESVALFLPEAVLTGAICLLIVLDLLMPKRQSRFLMFVALAAVVGAGALIFFMRSTINQPLFNGLIVIDTFASFLHIVLLLGAAIVIALSYVYRDFENRRMGEYYAIMLASLLGMFLMASANDLLMFVIGVELVSIPSYILVVYTKEDRAATEAGLKYVLYGSFASGVMIYGLSLLYGLTGSTNLADVSRFIVGNLDSFTVAVASLMAFAGFAFKISAVPFHWWAPDVYQGAPTPITAFLAVASKAAGFALLIRFLDAAVAGAGESAFHWLNAIAVFAALTMTVGNLAALWQENMKRLLAYSSIAHAGYMLMGLVAIGSSSAAMGGHQVVAFYLVAYLFMTLGAFVCVVAVYNLTGVESMSGYRGLGRRSPMLAFSMTIFLVSLIGLPPTAGFAGKFQLFAAAINSGYLWLAVIGGINTAISCYYYLRVMKVMYLDEPAVEPSSPAFVLDAQGLRWFAGVLVAAVLLVGIMVDLVARVTQHLIIVTG